jgi:hypothetical protein
MTSAIDITNERLERIHQAGYWRVVIHPTEFDERRIPTLGNAWSIVQAAQVALRGWDYPTIDEEERLNGGDYVQSGCDWANQIEI